LHILNWCGRRHAVIIALIEIFERANLLMNAALLAFIDFLSCCLRSMPQIWNLLLSYLNTLIQVFLSGSVTEWFILCLKLMLIFHLNMMTLCITSYKVSRWSWLGNFNFTAILLYHHLVISAVCLIYISSLLWTLFFISYSVFI